MSARYVIGDSLTVLRTLPDASVDLCLTSRRAKQVKAA
jgi:DNA modification methylase